jgi:hypothetical protein
LACHARSIIIGGMEAGRGRRRKRKRTWRDLSPRQRVGIVLLGTMQLALAGAAWRDLARRPAAQVRGPKWPWAMVIAMNWVGPLSYFFLGRIRHQAGSE